MDKNYLYELGSIVSDAGYGQKVVYFKDTNGRKFELPIDEETFLYALMELKPLKIIYRGGMTGNVYMKYSVEDYDKVMELYESFKLVQF